MKTKMYEVSHVMEEICSIEQDELRTSILSVSYQTVNITKIHLKHFGFLFMQSAPPDRSLPIEFRNAKEDCRNKERLFLENTLDEGSNFD